MILDGFQNEPNAPQIRLLLIDDNAIFLQSLSRFLSPDPRLTIVGACSNAKEGLEHAQRLQPDIIMVDLQMPGISGLAAIPALCAEVPDACILAMTLYDEKKFASAALKQ